MSGDSTNEWYRYLFAGSSGWSILNDPLPLLIEPDTVPLPEKTTARPPLTLWLIAKMAGPFGELAEARSPVVTPVAPVESALTPNPVTPKYEPYTPVPPVASPPKPATPAPAVESVLPRTPFA